MSNQIPQQGFQGTITPTSVGTPFNSISFIVQSLINGMATATMVRVTSVNNTGGLSQTGVVDIQPLLNQQDGYGNAVPHSIIHNCPYFRLQGGGNAVIMDPQVGDTGLAVFTDKDSSKIIANQQANGGAASSPANPDSARRFNFSDGMYFGGFLNGTPTQYVQFNSDGITVTTPNTVTVNAGSNVTVNATGSATVSSPSIALQNTGSNLLPVLNSLFSTWAANHIHPVLGADTGVPTVAPPIDTQTTIVTAE